MILTRKLFENKIAYYRDAAMKEKDSYPRAYALGIKVSLENLYRDYEKYEGKEIFSNRILAESIFIMNAVTAYENLMNLVNTFKSIDTMYEFIVRGYADAAKILVKEVFNEKVHENICKSYLEKQKNSIKSIDELPALDKQLFDMYLKQLEPIYMAVKIYE